MYVELWIPIRNFHIDWNWFCSCSIPTSRFVVVASGRFLKTLTVNHFVYISLLFWLTCFCLTFDGQKFLKYYMTLLQRSTLHSISRIEIYNILQLVVVSLPDYLFWCWSIYSVIKGMKMFFYIHHFHTSYLSLHSSLLHKVYNCSRSILSQSHSRSAII